MSSTLAPQGFLPVFHPSGQIVANPYTGLSTGSAVYKGDPVMLNSDGVCVKATEGSDANILGILAGVEYVNSEGKPVYTPYWPGSTSGATSIVMWVYDDPFIEYEVQANGSVAQTNIGNAADYAFSAGSSYTGVSASYLNYATMAADASQFRILQIAPRLDNAVGDTYTVVRVKTVQSQTVTTPNGV